jgi:replicative DNA helicase
MSAPVNAPDPFVDDRAERAVLGWLQLAPHDAGDLGELVAADDFADSRHGVIFSALVEVIGRTGGVDFAHVDEALRRRNAVNAVGGLQYVARCTDEVEEEGIYAPTAASALASARRVADLAQRRRLTQAAREMIALASSEATAEDALSAAATRLDAVARSRQVATGRPFAASLASLLGRDRSEAQGWPLPWPTLSAVLGGARRGRLVVVAGRPGKGKSALALCASLALAAPQAWDPRSLAAPVPVLFFAAEMPDEELAGRGAAVLARVDARALESGTLHESDVAEVVSTVAATRKAPLLIDDQTTQVTRMRQIAQGFFRKHGPGVMIVDYLQLCSPRGLDLERDATRERRVAEMTRAFKLCAKELGICVILVAQLNRGKSDTERPELRDLRESGAIEQDADAVVFLYGPKPKPGELTQKVLAYVPKVRGGAGEIEVEMLYRRAWTRFEEAPDAWRALSGDDAPQDDEPGYSVGGYEMGAPRG